MKKQLPTIAIILVCAVLAFMLLNANREIDRLKQQLKAVAEAPPAVAAPTKEPQKISAVQPRQKAYVQAEDEAIETNEVNAAIVENTLQNQQRIMSSIANMRDNPTMNKVIEASQRGTMGALYADMMDYLNLNDDETRYFMDLLMYRQMENVDFGMKLMSGQLSPEKKQEMAAHLKEVNVEMKEQMKTFLNSPEDYEEFEFYEKTMTERMALSQMDQQLAAIEQPLSDESYRGLLDMMHQEREDFDWTTDLHDQDKNDVSAERFSEDNMQKHTEDVSRLNKQIFDAARNILSAEQFAAFEASLQATTDMQLAQFQMAGQLLRGQE
ncbi:hypothetical protein P4B35_04765 [Pontiellaceae bacterium B12227]|nr:hypothetical protein [Pontiellaceae bacterium B12227]